MRHCVFLLAALALSSCSDSESPTAKDKTATAIQEKVTTPVEVVEIPVHAKAGRRPGKFASPRELRWAAAWMKWHKRFEPLFDQADSILSVPERRERAIEPWSKDNKSLQKAVRIFSSCSEDAVARGAPPSERLETLALETAAVCERVEKAAARLQTDGFQIGFPAEAILANQHLQDAIGEAWSFIPGLDLNVRLAEGASRRTRTQILYTLVASRLVGEQVTITCYSAADWRRELAGHDAPPRIGGFVEAHGATGNLAPVVCRWLDKLAYARERPQEVPALAYAAQAVLVLAHEAQHATGIRNEAKAECYAIQHMARLARFLGVDGSYANQLKNFVWTRVYPLDEPVYRSTECRPGGKLDLRPGVAAWP
jgi:hypothetical protein